MQNENGPGEVSRRAVSLKLLIDRVCQACTFQQRCFDQVEDINRGLDNAAEMYKLGSDKVEKEYQRNCLKAKALLFGEGGQENLIEPAKKIVDAKIKLSWWKY